MGKLVVLTLGEGDFEHRGFPVTLQIGDEGENPSTQDIGYLPPNPEIVKFYTNWQSTYRDYIRVKARLEKPKEQQCNISIDEVNTKAEDLSKNLKEWLKSREFICVREELLTKLNTDDELRFVISTSNTQLRQLPWHLWDLLGRYEKAEIALSAPKYQQVNSPDISKNQVNILAILGDSTEIDTEKDRDILNSIVNANTHFLVKPKRTELNDKLWDQPWDILFFAGHSRTESETGRIYINDTESLMIDDLKYALKKAISQGLQFAIFNSCDGLGLAQALEDLDIPQIIVMREPVPDKVAQEFLKHFLKLFSDGKSLYTSVREARERLQPLENYFPNATWLPVICQNPAQEPLTWERMRRKTGRRTKKETLSHLANQIQVFITQEFLPKGFRFLAAILLLVGFFSQRSQIFDLIAQTYSNLGGNDFYKKSYYSAINNLEIARKFAFKKSHFNQIDAQLSQTFLALGIERLQDSTQPDLEEAIKAFTKSLEYANEAYSGIGIEIQFDKAYKDVTIKRLVENCPAERAGLQIGDKILAVNGYLLSNPGLDNTDNVEETLYELLLDIKGSQVVIEIFREGKGNFQVKLTREQLLKPLLSEIYFNRGNAYRTLNSTTQAINDYTKSIENNSRRDIAYFNRGSIYSDIGAYERSIEDYNQAIQLNQKYAEAYEKRGLALNNLENNQGALKDLQKAASLYLEQGRADDFKNAERLIKLLSTPLVK